MNTLPENLPSHALLNFTCRGVNIHDALYIQTEKSLDDLPKCWGGRDPQPGEPFPRIRCMFPGSTFGRYAISDITNIEVLP